MVFTEGASPTPAQGSDRSDERLGRKQNSLLAGTESGCRNNSKAKRVKRAYA